MATKIHPTAVIDPKAQLDLDVEIGPYTVIGEDVQIGAATKIGPHCIFEFCTVGKNNLFTGAAHVGCPRRIFPTTASTRASPWATTTKSPFSSRERIPS